jgi:hypothetical protein
MFKYCITGECGGKSDAPHTLPLHPPSLASPSLAGRGAAAEPSWQKLDKERKRRYTVKQVNKNLTQAMNKGDLLELQSVLDSDDFARNEDSFYQKEWYHVNMKLTQAMNKDDLHELQSVLDSDDFAAAAAAEEERLHKKSFNHKEWYYTQAKNIKAEAERLKRERERWQKLQRIAMDRPGAKERIQARNDQEALDYWDRLDSVRTDNQVAADQRAPSGGQDLGQMKEVGEF